VPRLLVPVRDPVAESICATNRPKENADSAEMLAFHFDWLPCGQLLHPNLQDRTL